MPTAGPLRPGGGLYLHLPFCGAICGYCHFARTADHDPALRRRTVAAMIREFELRRDRCAAFAAGRRPLETAYVGGGTPSLLEPELMAELLAGTVGRLAAVTSPPTPSLRELTCEANPESFSPDLARAWREAGVDRVSLGVQSLDERVLRLLDRRCDPATARAALALAGRTFPRVAADWILGPDSDRDRLLAELDEALALGVEHLSLYILELHRGTPLAARVATGRVRLASDRQTERLYLACCEHLASRGFVHYEVSNFARPGAESRHNQAYWSNAPFVGLGPSASGFWARRRCTNHADLTAYLAAVEAGRLPEALIDPLDRRARRLERLILGLRTAVGVPLASLPDGALDLAAGEREGFWFITDQRLRMTSRGWLHLDTVEARLAAALG